MNALVKTPDVVPAMPASRHSRALSAAEVQAFGDALDQLRRDTVASLGADDADYIRKIRSFVRYSEIGSRAALMTLGWVPPVWLAASVMLGVSKIVNNMELGHNVMHGQYDWMNDPSLRGSTHEWDTVCTADNWRHTHNHMHHTYTNVEGVDHDIGYGVLRIFPEQKWTPAFLFNPVMAVTLAVSFQWLLALQSLELEKLRTGEKTLAEVRAELGPVLKKMRRQFAKDYVVFPLLAGPMFLPVLTGNLTANVIRNLWTFGIIFCGHFTEDAEIFPKSVLENETRGHWYLRQLRGSSNLTGGKWFHIMSGNLSHQIEHHLFPDIPGNRYEAMSEQVRALCAQYGQHYNTGSFRQQFGTVVTRILKGALPGGKKS